MKAEFTDSEKEIFKGKVLAIARKHGVSHTYVNMIINGEQELTTELTLKIYNGLKETAEFFKPINHE